MQGFPVSAALLFLLVLLNFCRHDSPVDNPSEYVLNQHLEFSQYTDPGEYAFLYKDLPESLDDICDLIKKQLIHPYDAHKFGDTIPEDRKW